jgi:hypothetical protein
LKGSTPDGTCGIGGGGTLTCTGQVKTLATTADGARTVETYAMQSSENWMEDAGSGELRRGVAVVTIDPVFARTISADPSYHVFLTPNGDSKGLYVIAKTPTTFEVRESGGGTSSLAFDYRIMAKRRGFEAQRLVDVTDRFAAEQASLKRRTTPNREATQPGLHSGPPNPTARPGAGSIPSPAGPNITPAQKTTAIPVPKTIASAASTELQK